MWRICLLLVIACGSNDPNITKPPSNTAPAAKPAATDDKVEDVAVRFARAALSGDRATAMSLTLTFDEMAKLSNKARDRADYDAEVNHLLDKLAKEGAEFGGAITGAKVVQTESLDPATDEKVLQKIEFAVVEITVKEADGREHAAPFPWFFLKAAGAGWKYSPKK